MSAQQFMSIFEKMTRKLAETFTQLNQLCVQELSNLQNQIQKQQQIPQPPSLPVIEQVVITPIEVDSSEEAPNKESKTKKIKKQNNAEESPKYVEQIKTKKRTKKVSHKPKAPASSFLLFFKEQQSNMAEAYPTFGVTELTKVAAKLWKQLSKEEKEPYIKLCDDERKTYQQKMQKYKIEFPDEIAQKVKDRKLLKKQKKNGGKDATPKKQKTETQKKANGLANQQQPINIADNQKSIEQEQSDSQQFMRDELSDSLGMI